MFKECPVWKSVSPASWNHKYCSKECKKIAYSNQKKDHTKKHSDDSKRIFIKSGDKVEVTRKVNSGERKWGGTWNHKMDFFVGSIYEVTVFTEDECFLYDSSTGEGYWFPQFILKKVDDKKKIKEMTYEEAQKEWIKNNNIKSGDKVIVIRKAEDGERGWCNVWGDTMDRFVNKTVEIQKSQYLTFTSKIGISVYNEECGKCYNFPYFVLEKVEDKKEGVVEMTYEEAQREWVKKNGIKEGDIVKIVRKAKDGERGWRNVWWGPMDDCVNKIGEIRKGQDLTIPTGVSVYNEEWGNCYNFPYFVLEKVEDKKEDIIEMAYEEAQREWVKKNDIKMGDKVKIVRKAGEGEGGWYAGWDDHMDTFVGKIGEIIRDPSLCGNAGLRIIVSGQDQWYFFPYFVLEKVNEDSTKKSDVDIPECAVRDILDDVINESGENNESDIETPDGAVLEILACEMKNTVRSLERLRDDVPTEHICSDDAREFDDCITKLIMFTQEAYAKAICEEK